MPTRDGTVPEAVSQAYDRGLFQLPPAPGLRTSAVGATWKIPVILVDFTDQPLTYVSTADWERALFDTTGATSTGSVFDYYRWVSGRRIRVLGQVVATVHLDFAKSYYANNAWGLSASVPNNSYGVVDHALRKCASQVDWSEFDRDLDGYVDMLWVVHSGLGGENVVTRQDLWSITSRLSQWTGGSVYRTEDLVPGTNAYERIDAFSILPELSAFHPGNRSEIGVFCHEFGHALGLPDLYDTAPLTGVFNVGPGNWTLMSTGVYGGNGASPEYPVHVGAWPMSFLGWSQPVRPTEDSLWVLPSLEGGGSTLELWFQGEASPEHFLVENRQREGFDRNLPGTGLLVYQVDDVAIRAGLPSNRVIGGYGGLRVVEGDGGQELMLGQSRGDGADPMPGTTGLTRWDDGTWPNSRSRDGNVTYVGLLDMSSVGDSMRFRVHVRAPGWQPPRRESGPGFLPVLGSGPATHAALLQDSSIVSVTSELIAGRPQVVFRDRRPNHSWDTPLQISQSLGAATEPSVAALPGGDVCVVWSDSRHGANELYYRSRIRGVWTPEQRLTDLQGYSRTPALGADRRGGVHLAWLYQDGAGSRVFFMYFTYLSPFGDPIPVTPADSHADAPALTVAPNGSSYILWPAGSTSPTSLWYSRFAADSGMRVPQQLVVPTIGALPSVNGTVDAAGRLHYVWQVGGIGGAEIHYQSRGATTSEDTLLVRRGESIQDIVLAATPDGGLHLVMEATTAGATQILYKEWRSNGGWDIGTTEVTRASDGTATRPAVLPRRSGAVTVLYIDYSTGAAAFMERDRGLWEQPLTAVPNSGPFTPAGWRVLPNPLQAGSMLRLRWDGVRPSPARLEVFDLGGRRVAAADLRGDRDRWVAEIPGSVTRSWASGVYFARLGGEAAHARIVVLR